MTADKPSNKQVLMKQIFLDLSEAKAIGDTICSTPVIKKLYESYNSKIFVISEYIELFQNNPYVHKCYTPNSLNLDFIKKTSIYHNSFTGIGKKNQRGVECKHNNIDIRQFHAIQLGFMLSPHEMECFFNPEPYEEIENLPDKYVLIHPVQNWPSRTWSADKWMLLTEMLNSQNISVVSIGKDSSETGFFNIKKPTFNFKITNGLNLMNQTTLSQTWHLMERSLCFITMDSGLLHIAGTTDCNIIHLGSSIKPEFRRPYRNGSQDYKNYYLSGGCNIACASDMKHGVREWGSIQGVPPLIGCLENKPTYECHPSVMQVFNKIMELYKKNPYTKEKNEIKISYLDGPKVEILGDIDEKYHVEFLDEFDNIIHEDTITNNMWTKCFRSNYTKWKIKINGNVVDFMKNTKNEHI